jgi:hypothetical protein
MRSVPHTISEPRPDARPPIAAVVLDLGGVLIDWDPRHLYRSLFALARLGLLGPPAATIAGPSPEEPAR